MTSGESEGGHQELHDNRAPFGYSEGENKVLVPNQTTLVIEWRHTSEELKWAYQAAKGVAQGTRLQALWLLREGKSMGEAQQLMGVGYRTLQRWVGWYRVGGLEEVLRRTPGHAGG